MVTEQGRMLMTFIEFLASNEIALLIFNSICIIILILCAIYTTRENKKKEAELEKVKAESEFYTQQVEAEMYGIKLFSEALKRINKKYAPVKEMTK